MCILKLKIVATPALIVGDEEIVRFVRNAKAGSILNVKVRDVGAFNIYEVYRGSEEVRPSSVRTGWRIRERCHCRSYQLKKYSIYEIGVNSEANCEQSEAARSLLVKFVVKPIFSRSILDPAYVDNDSYMQTYINGMSLYIACNEEELPYAMASLMNISDSKMSFSSEHAFKLLARMCDQGRRLAEELGSYSGFERAMDFSKHASVVDKVRYSAGFSKGSDESRLPVVVVKGLYQRIEGSSSSGVASALMRKALLDLVVTYLNSRVSVIDKSMSPFLLVSNSNTYSVHMKYENVSFLMPGSHVPRSINKFSLIMLQRLFGLMPQLRTASRLREELRRLELLVISNGEIVVNPHPFIVARSINDWIEHRFGEIDLDLRPDEIDRLDALMRSSHILYANIFKRSCDRYSLVAPIMSMFSDRAVSGLNPGKGPHDTRSFVEEPPSLDSFEIFCRSMKNCGDSQFSYMKMSLAMLKYETNVRAVKSYVITADFLRALMSLPASVVVVVGMNYLSELILGESSIELFKNLLPSLDDIIPPLDTLVPPMEDILPPMEDIFPADIFNKRLLVIETSVVGTYSLMRSVMPWLVNASRHRKKIVDGLFYGSLAFLCCTAPTLAIDDGEEQNTWTYVSINTMGYSLATAIVFSKQIRRGISSCFSSISSYFCRTPVQPEFTDFVHDPEEVENPSSFWRRAYGYFFN